MFESLFGLFGGRRDRQLHEFYRDYFEEKPNQPLIRLQEIRKSFEAGDVTTNALSGVNLEIRRGEFVTVSGPSGCGKSTLLHTVGLLERPSSGHYYLNGNHVEGLKPAQLAWLRNKAVGFIFQNFNLIGDLTVLENVETPLTYVGMPQKERRDRALECLQNVAMDGFIKRYPSQLTGGEQQRVAVARSIVGEPLILLADEPTGNLDSQNGERVMSLLEGLHKRGATVLLVTHNPEYATRSTREVHLFDGDVVPAEAVAGEVGRQSD